MLLVISVCVIRGKNCEPINTECCFVIYDRPHDIFNGTLIDLFSQTESISPHWLPLIAEFFL